MALALDEIDYGVLLLGELQQVLHCNHAARLALSGEHPLVLDHGWLRVRDAQDQQPLEDALEAASLRRLRRLLTLGYGAQRVEVSVVPLPAASPGEADATLMVLPRSSVYGGLSVQGFARAHKLSNGEVRVLMALCAGAGPSQVAESFGVALSTVRSQIANIRAKTGAESIRDLIHKVSVLPPLMGALRSVPETAAPSAGKRRQAMGSPLFGD